MAIKERRVGKLKHLIVNRVALVDAGANQHADIVLYKAASSQAATNSLTLTPPSTTSRRCPVCKNEFNVGVGICTECGWTVGDDDTVIKADTATTKSGPSQIGYLVEKRSDVMRTIDYLARAEHEDLYEKSAPQAIHRYVSDHPDWLDKNRAAEPDAADFQAGETPEPVEKIAGGPRGAFLAEAISKGASEIADKSGLSWLDSYQRFIETEKGWVLFDAYQDAIQ